MPFSDEKLRDIAELLSMDVDDVVHSVVIKTRSGIPTEKGLLIFKVAPLALLHTTSIHFHDTKLIFYWMDKDTQCDLCTHRGHHNDSCPSAHYDSLPAFGGSDEDESDHDEDTPTPSKEDGEKEPDSNKSKKAATETKTQLCTGSPVKPPKRISRRIAAASGT